MSEGFRGATVLTHCNAPGAFTVGSVEAGEPLTTNKTRLCDLVSSTVEHRPEMKQALMRTTFFY